MYNQQNTHLNFITKKIELAYYHRSSGTKRIVNRIVLQLGDFSFENVKNYIDKVNTQYRISTKNTIKAYLLSIINKVKEYLEEDIYDFIKDFARQKEVSKNRSVNKIAPLINNLSLCEEFYHWFYQKNQKLALVFKTVMETGLRISEVKTIDLSECFYDMFTINIDYYSSKGKGYKEITVHQELYQSLIVLGEQPFHDIDISNYSNVLKYYIQKYNKENNQSFPVISIHKLRHLHASLLLKNGVNLSLVSKRLGHSNPMITSKFYDDTSIEVSQLISIGLPSSCS